MTNRQNVSLNDLKKVLDLTHRHDTPQNQRRDAYIFLQNFERNADLCLAASREFIKLNERTEFRHYGLSLLEKQIKVWDKLPQNHQKDLRDLVEKLLHHVKPIGQETKYIKCKTVKLVDLLAQHR
eukprot:UN01599